MSRHKADKQRRSGIRLLAIGITTLMGALTLTAAPGSASTTPAVTFGSTHNLFDGQVVRVRITGADPGTLYFVRQCSASPSTLSDCSTATPVRTDDSGNGLLLYPISVSIDSGHLISGAPTLRCGVGANCSLVFLSQAQATTPAAGIIQAVDFAAADALCPATGQTVVGAEGSAAYTQMALALQPTVCQAPTNVTLDFIASKGDSGSRQDFLCKLRDVALTEVPGSPDEACGLDGTKRSYTYVPVANTSLVLAYKMRDALNGQVVEDFKLTPNMVAWIFTALVPGLTSYPPSDVRAGSIATLNGSHQLARSLTPVGRADASGVNLLFTRYLINNAAAAWHAGGPNFDIQQPSEFYPAQSGLDLRSSGAAVARLIGTSDDTDALLGWIGVMDKSSADFYGLPQAALGNSNDVDAATFVEPTSDAVTRGIDAMIDAGQGTQMANVAPRDPAAYPLVATVYAMVPTDTSVSDARAKAIRNWLIAQRDLTTLPSGYVPLTDDQKSAITDVLPKIVGAAESAPTDTTTDTSSSAGATDFGSFGTDTGAGSDDSSTTGIESGATDSGSAAASTPLTSIFASASTPGSGSGALLLPILILVGLTTSVIGSWRLVGASK